MLDASNQASAATSSADTTSAAVTNPRSFADLQAAIESSDATIGPNSVAP